MVNDVTAVNSFMEEARVSGNSTESLLENCDYIEYVQVIQSNGFVTDIDYSNSTVPNQTAGVFWAVVNRLFIIFQVIMLVLSELGRPAQFFDRFFPVLGSSFGLGPLGIFQGLYVAFHFYHLGRYLIVAIASVPPFSHTTLTTSHSSLLSSSFLSAA